MAVPLTVPIFIPRSSSIKTQLFLQRANLRDKSSPLIQYPLLIPHPLDEFVESDHSDDDLFDDYDDSLYPPNLLSSQCSSLTCYSHNLSFLLPSRSFAISTSQCQPVTVSPQLSSVRSKSTTNLRKALELLQHVAKNQVPKNPNSLISRFNPRFRQITRVQAQLHPLEIDNNDSNTSLITNDDNSSHKNEGEFPVDVSSSSVMSLLAFPSTPKELLATLFCSSEPRDAALTKIHENVAPVELQTWSIKHEHSMIDNPCIPVKPTRNREYRINSRFLLMYAVDCKARMEGYLPATHESSSIAPSPNSQPLAVVARFQAQYDVEKVSNMSRDKLWANVILPARSDTLPALRGAPDFHQYVYVNQEYAEDVKLDTKLSIVKLDGCDYLPWVNLRQQLKSVKPAGAMTRGPTMANGLIPSSGVLKTQFTVKGWSNKRWLPSELDL